TAIIVGNLSGVLGVISIADTVREDAKALIDTVKRLGIAKIAMLTGDNPGTAKSISDQLGIDEYYAELLPQDKVRILNELRTRYGAVAMVGDGVNDAPALASAD